jgi:hypothetical protein
MKQVTGSSQQTITREIGHDELNVFKMFGFTEQQAKEYINRTNKK